MAALSRQIKESVIILCVSHLVDKDTRLVLFLKVTDSERQCFFDLL